MRKHDGRLPCRYPNSKQSPVAAIPPRHPLYKEDVRFPHPSCSVSLLSKGGGMRKHDGGLPLRLFPRFHNPFPPYKKRFPFPGNLFSHKTTDKTYFFHSFRHFFKSTDNSFFSRSLRHFKSTPLSVFSSKAESCNKNLPHFLIRITILSSMLCFGD